MPVVSAQLVHADVVREKLAERVELAAFALHDTLALRLLSGRLLGRDEVRRGGARGARAHRDDGFRICEADASTAVDATDSCEI